MQFISRPSIACYKLMPKSHLKFDLDNFVPEHLPQPAASMYSDLEQPRNTLLDGPNFEEPLSRYTISATKDKKSPCGCGLLTGNYRKMLGADV